MPSGGTGTNVPGLFRGVGWLAAGTWWGVKSPTGMVAMGAAAIPWFASSVLNIPTAGLSIILALGFYAYLCLWSALCAGTSFAGAPFDWAALKKAWIGLFGSSRSLALAFLACALVGLVWTQLCVSGTGIGVFLESLHGVESGDQARELLSQAWSKDGFDGLLLPFVLHQFGLGFICAVWCLLPARAVGFPQEGVKDLLKFGIGALKSAPFAMWALGVTGAIIAQAGVIFAPISLLSGFWFVACAYAARDMSKN